MIIDLVSIAAFLPRYSAGPFFRHHDEMGLLAAIFFSDTSACEIFFECQIGEQ